MQPKGQKNIARAIMLVLGAAGLFWLARIDFAQKISTNVIDLIPRDEQSPELAAVHSIVNNRQARTVLFALRHGTGAGSEVATTAFAATLRESGEFEEVSELSDPKARDALGRFIYEHRLQLLLPIWLTDHRKRFESEHPTEKDFSVWLAEQAVNDLDKFLARPESVAFRDLVPTDPLLLVPHLAEKAQGLGVGSTQSNQPGLIWALLRPSPFTEAGQQPIFKIIDSALNHARETDSELQLEWTGVNRFAAESRRQIQGELSWLNTVSLIAVFGVAVLFVRRVWKAIHLVPVVLFSLLGAWVATTVFFPRTHILVFVLGSLLSGVAIDYGFYLYVQPTMRLDESYREKLSRLLKPLLASCLTTVIGFLFLLFSELPLIRQLGVFVSGGLISALLGAILYFAQLEKPFLETRTVPALADRLSIRWRRIILGCAAAAALVGWFRLSWHDDVRELEVPTPEVQANDIKVRGYFGDQPGRAVYLTRGNDLADARENLARFLAWHDAHYPEAPGSSLAWLIPSRADLQSASGEKLELFLQNFRIALDQHGYDPASFDAFFLAVRTEAPRMLSPNQYQALADQVVRRLTGPIALLVSDPNGSTTPPTPRESAWFITLANHPSNGSLPADLATIPLSQLETLNELFVRYRMSALRLSSAGLGLVGLSVFVLYGLRRGIRIFSIPAGSAFFAFGLLGLIGHPLNLFYLLGAFLGVCLSHNYSIFSAENALRHEPPPPSIRLSALCTAASFGVLAFSKIPVVSALGTIVTILVLTALLIVEFRVNLD